MDEPHDDKNRLYKIMWTLCEILSFISRYEEETKKEVFELARRAWLALACLASDKFQSLCLQDENYANVLEKYFGIRLVTRIEGKVDGIIKKEELNNYLERLELKLVPESDAELFSIIEQLSRGPCKLEIDTIEVAKVLVLKGVADIYIVPRGLPMDNPLWFGENIPSSNNIEPDRMEHSIHDIRTTLSGITNQPLRNWLIKAVNRLETLVKQSYEPCPECGAPLQRFPLGITTHKGYESEIVRCTKCRYVERMT